MPDGSDHPTASRYATQLVNALERHSSRIALVDSTRQWTYRQLHQRMYQYVHALRTSGLRVGDGVAMLGQNSFDYVALFLAIPVAGMHVMCLHSMESAASHGEQLAYGKMRAVVVDAALAKYRIEDLIEVLPPACGLFTIGPSPIGVGTDLDALADAAPTGLLRPEFSASGILELGLTGGSTGSAKACIDDDRSYLFNHLVTLSCWELPRHPTFVISTPISHGMAGTAIAPALYSGAMIALLSAFDPGEVLYAIERYRANAAILVPSAIYALLDHPDLGRRDSSSLDMLWYGGSAITPGRAAEALDRFGPVLLQTYGSREAKTVTVLRRDEHDPARPESLLSCGRACVGVTIALLDGGGHPVGRGDIGEICSRNPASSPGYWRRPADTEELHAHGWVHSGDLARMDPDGYLTIVDRAKDMIVSGGHNLFPRQIEDVLGTHPGVSASAVFGVPDQRWGEAVKAVVVLREGFATSAEELMEHVRRRSGSAVAPKSIDFLSELPLTTAGKTDKKALRAPYWAGQTRSVG
jgi:fatty-acyl-CoA synthase